MQEQRFEQAGAARQLLEAGQHAGRQGAELGVGALQRRQDRGELARQAAELLAARGVEYPLAFARVAHPVEQRVEAIHGPRLCPPATGTP